MIKINFGTVFNLYEVWYLAFDTVIIYFCKHRRVTANLAG